MNIIIIIAKKFVSAEPWIIAWFLKIASLPLDNHGKKEMKYFNTKYTLTEITQFEKINNITLPQDLRYYLTNIIGSLFKFILLPYA
jgi:hypothetical protein